MILHLDADTTVQESYLDAADELRELEAAGGVLPFAHQPAPDPALQSAIDCYELVLYYYLEGLRWADSPYAFHTVGSTMVSSVSGYVRARGMPAKRQAGEDFYFLQNIAKTGQIVSLRCTTVFPSPRVSKRVPFGTGARMVEAVEQGEDRFRVCDPICFGTLRQVLECVHGSMQLGAEGVLAHIENSEARRFLEGKGFLRRYAGFLKQFGPGDRCLDAFDRWFDALTQIQLIHHLTDESWPEKELLAAWEELSERQAVKRPCRDVSGLLRWCRDRWFVNR